MTEDQLKEKIGYNKRRAEFQKEATKIIQQHGPLLSNVQAREIARIALLAWQDLRNVYAWNEADNFLSDWR